MGPHAWIFTDGSCHYRDRIGGWAGVILLPNASRSVFGCSCPTTVNRCEAEPLVTAMRELRTVMLRRHTGLTVAYVTDSEITARIAGGASEPDDNMDLWEAYRELSEDCTVVPIWRERNSHPVMVHVDAMAYAMRETLKPAGRLFQETPGWSLVQDLAAQYSDDLRRRQNT